MYQPDQIDWKIIKLLNKDGRMSSAEIARRLGNITARTINNRINVLIEQDIINIHSIINPEAIGYCVLADVFIETEAGRLLDVAEQVSKLPQVSYLACATGDTDVIVSLRARELKELFDFIIEKIGKIPGVRHTQTYLLPVKIKDNASWLPPDVLDNGEGNDSSETHPKKAG